MTWNEVVWFFEKNYDMKYDKESQLISVTLSFTDKRSQLVMLRHQESQNGTEYVAILSRVGKLQPSQLRDALITTTEKICGGLCCISGEKEYYYVRSTLPLKGLDADALKLSMVLCAVTADELEEQYVGGDDQ